MNRTALCITGMHRSGTSLFTSWINHCGLTLTNSEGSGIGNENGLYEDKDIRLLHRDMIIDLYGKRSKGWKVKKYEPHYQHNIDPTYFEKALKLVDERSIEGLWGWKDPRTSLFLEFWKEIVPNLKVIATWRDCENVTDSLVRRSKRTKLNDLKRINKRKAYKTWIAYNSAILDFKEKYPDRIMIVKIDQIVEEPELVFGKINNFLDTNNLSYKPFNEKFDKKLLKRSKMMKSSSTNNIHNLEMALERQSIHIND